LRSVPELDPLQVRCPARILEDVIANDGGLGRQEEQRARGRQSNNSYDSNSVLRVLGNGTITAEQTKELTEEEKRAVNSRSGANGL
jgi:hypothetical protein